MDWKKMVADLIHSGMTQSELATKAGCSQNLISDLVNGKRGKRLTYKIGEKIVDLHENLAMTSVAMNNESNVATTPDAANVQVGAA